MTRFERLAVWISSGLTIATGVGYALFRYFVRSDDPFAVVNHPLEPWFLRAHIVTAPTLIYAIGVISVRHVWQHIRRKVPAGRGTGWTMSLSVVPMILTGYLIQVVTHPFWLRALVVAHLVTGLLFAAALVGHAWLFARRRSRRLRSPGEPVSREPPRIPAARRRASRAERATTARRPGTEI
ncbi:MAG: hypothetical protein R3266_02475 [Gemmatimonadota bacterium]|nr:hypothetical protein [Gemmatimonadota bacterium]